MPAKDKAYWKEYYQKNRVRMDLANKKWKSGQPKTHCVSNHYTTRQMKYKCEKCSKICDGTLYGTFKTKLLICSDCFDEESEKSKPIIMGNRYYLAPLEDVV